MEIITFDNPNDNSEFLLELINKTEYCNSDDYYWVITDLDLIPRFHGDYMGNGGAVSEEIAYSFLQNYEKTGIAIMNYNNLVNLLKDSQCVRNVIILCFSKQVFIDTNTFRPKVESSNPDKLSHNEVKIEVRILDGDLFYILKNKLV